MRYTSTIETQDTKEKQEQERQKERKTERKKIYEESSDLLFVDLVYRCIETRRMLFGYRSVLRKKLERKRRKNKSS
jgi:hypothetical protein